MKYLIGLLCFFSVAQAQYAPTSAKTKFVNGIGIGSKDTSQFTAADTIALTIARDSVMYYRYRGFWRPIATGGNLSAYKLISDTLFNNGYTTRARLKQGLDSLAATKGTVNSVGLTMPSAFSVANSPITNSGTIAVTAAGNATQYIRGDGALATLPTSGSGGGASVSYYLNGSVNQGTFGGVTYYEMNQTPIIGAGTNFTINADGYIAQFITDANDPALLKIPAGNWNFETFFSASSGGGTPTYYIELYKYNGTTFTLIASNSGSPKLISDGTNIEAYFSTLAVPETVLTLTDRLAIRIYVSHSGRTITLHTENSHLCQIITTFTTGLTALNGLTEQVQYLATGTSGTDFNIASSVATHTFNLPTASATNRGALSSANWTTFNNKIGAGDTAAMLLPYYKTATATAALATKLNISDTAAMLSPYRRTSTLIQQSEVNGLSTSLAAKVNVSDTAAMLTGYKTYYPRTAISAGTGITYNAATGVITNSSPSSGGTVTSVATNTGSGITGGTITTTGTIAADTSILSTKANVTGLLVGYTTTAANALKLNISDTASMLSNYRRTSTKITNSDLVNSAITINGSSTALGGSVSVGTVTSVTASAPLASSGGATPNITITQASGSTNGFLSSTDWTTFNNKQNALTNPVTGTGTTNYLPKFTGASTIGNSALQEVSGNLGLGVTPSAWGSNYKVLQIGNAGFWSQTAAGTGTFVSQNGYFDGTTFKYISTSAAALYIQDNVGIHSWYNAPSGTAGAAISFTQAMTLFSDGNLLLTNGTVANAGFRLDVNGTGRFSGSVQEMLRVTSSATSGTVFLLSNTSTGGGDWRNFSTGSGNGEGAGHLLWTYNGASPFMMIKNNGNVGIGTTTPGTRLEVFSRAADADRTIPHNVLTLTAEQGNAPYGFFGGAILFKNRSYVSGMVESARIRSVIYDDGAPNNFGGGFWFETTPTPGGALTPSLVLNYQGRVGIGTTAPTEKLDVIGGAVAAGNGTIRTGITYSSLGLIGTFTNHDLGVITNGSERMRITSGGNVLIGNPPSDNGAAFQVNGSATVSGTLGINGVADNVKSGTYTPTITNNLNTSGYTVLHSSYIRVGNICYVTMKVSFTASNSVCGFNATVPFGNNFSNNDQVAGSQGVGVNGLVMYSLVSSASTNQIFTSMSGATVGSNIISFSFQYIIQ